MLKCSAPSRQLSAQLQRLTVRPFSSSRPSAEDRPAPTPSQPRSRPSNQNPAGEGRRQVRRNTASNVQKLYQRSSASDQSTRTVRIIGSSSRAPNADFIPRRDRSVPVDARALGASNILNASASKLLRASPRLRSGRGGKPAQGQGRRRRGKQAAAEDGDADLTPETIQYLTEKAERSRPRPVRYEPQGETVDSLRATWPALPIGETANVESVVEKLSWMSERYANGHDPPEELAAKVFEGKRVLFANAEEQAAVMALVGEMEAARAARLSERKGEVVEAKDVSFEAVSEPERQDLLRKLVQGEYPKPTPAPKDAAPIVADVLRNLANNETYQGSQSSQFMAKLESLLPKPGQARPRRVQT